MDGIGRLLRWATTDQYAAIDAEQGGEPVDRRCVGVIILVILTVVPLRYWGMSSFITEVAAVKPYLELFPTALLGGKLYWVGCRFLAYFLVPAAIVLWGFGERLSDYGLRIDKRRPVLALYLAMFLTVVPLAFALSRFPSFLVKYPFYADAGRSWADLLIWETAYAAQFFALEFYYRGFVLFVLARRFGSHAIFIATVPYVMIHFGKPVVETYGAMIAGIALGTLALRTRSIFGGVVVHTAVAWSMDFFGLLQKGQLAGLFGR